MKSRNFILPALNFRTRKGFTLIELLVVMAIIVIISGLSLAGWRGGERQYALLRAASKLSQDIRKAEEMAMSAREFQGQIPQGGYGVYFKIQEPDHYILFADLNGNQQYDSGSDGLIEDVKIEKDVQISQLSASPLTITFTPPDPTVSIKPDASTATITLAIKTDPTKTKTIRVNKSGLVYIGIEVPSPTCLTCYRDADGDGYHSTSGSQICDASSCPSGYSGTAGNDCNDADATKWQNLTGYQDFDSDTYTIGSAQIICSGASLPPGWRSVAKGTDCNDNNPSIYPGTSGGLTCSVCQSDGTIIYQTSSQDLFNDCGTTGCYNGLCNGSGACGYYTSGDGACPICQTCVGATSGSCLNYAAYNEDTGCTTKCKGCSGGSCVNIPNATTDTYGSLQCTATHYRCDGFGACTAPAVLYGMDASCNLVAGGPYPYTWSQSCGYFCPSVGGECTSMYADRLLGLGVACYCGYDCSQGFYETYDVLYYNSGVYACYKYTY